VRDGTGLRAGYDECVALASPRVIGRNMLRDERQRSGIAVQGNVQAIRLDRARELHLGQASLASLAYQLDSWTAHLVH